MIAVRTVHVAHTLYLGSGESVLKHESCREGRLFFDASYLR